MLEEKERAESLTRIVVEDDVDQVLVSPGDVLLVLVVERHQELPPAQAHGGHVILGEQGRGHVTTDPQESSCRARG